MLELREIKFIFELIFCFWMKLLFYHGLKKFCERREKKTFDILFLFERTYDCRS